MKRHATLFTPLALLMQPAGARQPAQLDEAQREHHGQQALSVIGALPTFGTNRAGPWPANAAKAVCISA